MMICAGASTEALFFVGKIARIGEKRGRAFCGARREARRVARAGKREELLERLVSTRKTRSYHMTPEKRGALLEKLVE